MGVLSGHELAQIDKQGRIVVPTLFRPALGGEFYAFPDGRYVGCLVFAPREWFAKMVDELRQQVERFREITQERLDEELLKQADKWVAAFQYLVGCSKILKMDGQGRVVLPEGLLRIAGLSRDMRVIVAGMVEVVKVWSQEAWERFREEVTAHYRFLMTRGELGGKG